MWGILVAGRRQMAEFLDTFEELGWALLVSFLIISALGRILYPQ